MARGVESDDVVRRRGALLLRSTAGRRALLRQCPARCRGQLG